MISNANDVSTEASAVHIFQIEARLITEHLAFYDSLPFIT
jgi:hypothetical protein